MVLFFIGIIEMLILTTWTKFVAKTKILATGAVTMVNVLIWYYVLQQIVRDLNDYKLVLLYALGCSVGSIISMLIFRSKENQQKQLLRKMKNNL